MRMTMLALMALLLSGCLLSHEYKRVIREKEPLRPSDSNLPKLPRDSIR